MTSTTRLFRPLPALLSAAAALLWQLPAAAVTIDSFTTNQAAVTDPPGTSTVATGGADILGTRRALTSDLLNLPVGTSGTGPVSTSVTGGALVFTIANTTPDSRGEGYATWDGDTAPTNLNVTGLGGQDLTAGGLHNSIHIRVNSASAGTEIVVDVYSSATASSRGFLRIPSAIAAATDLYLTYKYDFVATNSSPADFANVGAVEMRVRGTEISASIDLVETTGPTLLASKRDLDLANSPIAAPVLEGGTFKYRVQLDSQNGLATGIDLTDTVDANTTLDAASVRATPVAIDDAYITAGHVGRSVAAPGLLANDFDPDNNGSAPELVVAAASVGTFATTLGGSITIAADGSFSYEPPVNFHRTIDTYTYTVQDNDGQTSTGLFKIALGRRVWFVDDAHPGTNAGTLANPFVGFTTGNVNGTSGTGDRDADGDIIYMRTGTHVAQIELEPGEWLYGEGEDLTLDGQQIVAAGTDPVVTSSAHGVILSSNNTVRGFTVGNTAAGSFDIIGANFGTLTASNLVLNGTGGALSLTTGAVAASFDSLASTSGTTGMLLSAVTGNLSVAGATSFSTTAKGIEVSGGSTASLAFNATVGITVSNGFGIFASSGTLGFTGSSNTVAATNGAAIDLANVSLGAGATFATVTSTNSSGRGLSLDTVTGNFAGNGGAISGSTLYGVDVNAGSSTISYAGTVSGARVAEITSRTGGSVTLSGNLTGTTGPNISLSGNLGGTHTFSGASKVLNAGTGTAVSLASNSGATIDFTGGGLDIDVTSGTGFTATGGAAAITVQGTGNSITATSGTALNVASSTIGAAGLTFEAIAANGAANPLVLSSTGASGGLTVTGVGTTPGSGGTIQNISGRGASFTSVTGVNLKNMNFTNTATSAGSPCGSAAVTGANTGCNAAIHLQSTSNVTLDRVNLTTSGQQGINVIDVNGFTLSNAALSGLGNAADEDGIHALNLLGTVAFTSTTIASSGDDNVNIQNRSSTASTITFTGGSFNTGVLGSGLLFGIRDSSSTNLTISGVTSNNNFSGGIVVDTFDTATTVLNVTGSTITNNNDGIQVSASQTSSAQFDIDNNDFIGNDFLAVTVLKAAFSTGGTLEGAIRNNNPITIGNGQTTDAISIFQAGGGALKVAVTNNVINYAGTQRAILVQAGQDGNGTVDFTMTGNTVDVQLDGAGNAVAGVLAQTAITGPGNTASVCADIGGAGGLSNTFTHSLGGTMAGGDIRVRQRNDGTFRLPGFGGPATNTANVIAYLAGRNTLVSAATATADSTGFGGGGACSAPVIP